MPVGSSSENSEDQPGVKSSRSLLRMPTTANRVEDRNNEDHRDQFQSATQEPAGHKEKWLMHSSSMDSNENQEPKAVNQESRSASQESVSRAGKPIKAAKDLDKNYELVAENLPKTLNPKFRAAILGATGSVGQRFVSLLSNHPWIEVVALAASENSAGKKYREACQWRLEKLPSQRILAMEVWDAVKDAKRVIENCDVIFSALSAQLAKTLETDFSAAGLAVFSNASAHRYDNDVPILIPHVNYDHLNLVKQQKHYSGGGFICANANCSSAGVAVALAPLRDQFGGIKQVLITTMQAVSGAGYPGLSWWDIQNNVIPHIQGEEAKLELEPTKILGTRTSGVIEPALTEISAMIHRVPVTDGHLISMSIKFNSPPSSQDIVKLTASAYKDYQTALPKFVLQLPSMPTNLIRVTDREYEPQPRLHVDEGDGMTVTVGKLRPCRVLDLKLTCLVHNTVLGAAGGSIANAELAIATGILR